ncbi:YbdD/YjiX family protein [Saccharopolyspora sp. TS4A08]|uniref:YbdD/YjiX family protein n=1 Tax=Saccharopolyspora ipomoeae TaxID=3042027 RepID=A0ABT6PUJ6_9PSEU|nr:YbdD/YjiX family protein [Saccharopolyspora sp. TS4A08]MDI2031675.1 YbdD/YjiX family protein [Saccharopolyspora sp. TS4A08]
MTGTTLTRLRGSVRAAWQIVRGVVGETAYETYLEHHRTHHPDQQPMSEREFWKAHIDKQDANPGSRCC